MFFLHCIFSYCFFNKWGERAAAVTPFVLCCTAGESLSACLLITTTLYYLQSSMLAFEGTSFG